AAGDHRTARAVDDARLKACPELRLHRAAGDAEGALHGERTEGSAAKAALDDAGAREVGRADHRAGTLQGAAGHVDGGRSERAGAVHRDVAAGQVEAVVRAIDD